MLEEQQIIRIDGIKWWITSSQVARFPVPLCPQHNIRLDPKPGLIYSSILHKYVESLESTATIMECAEGPHSITIPRAFDQEKKYVINRVDALIFKTMSVLNLDDEAVPVANEEFKKDSPFWIKAKITESKSGTRLIIWAGDKSQKNKTQLFIEPALKRLSFDQNDNHPTEVFAKVEATFVNKVISKIEKKN